MLTETLLIIALIIWISCCLISFFFGKADTKMLVKFIGGFCVALIAIHANNTYVYFLSIGITGLIIASEKFMSVLVALIRGNSDVWENDNFMKTVEKMSPVEIEHKTQQEINEIQEVIKEKPITKTSPKEKELQKKVISRYVKSFPELEKKALHKFERLTGIAIKEQVRFGQLLLDGLGVSGKGNKLYLFEVKLIPDKSATISNGDLAEKIANMVRKTLPNITDEVKEETKQELYQRFDNFTIMFIIVVDSNRNLDQVMERIGTLKLAYNDPQNNIVVRFTFYNSSKL